MLSARCMTSSENVDELMYRSGCSLRCSVIYLAFAIMMHFVSSAKTPNHQFNTNDTIRMRDRVKTMFNHGFDNYMKHAFPHDELKPLSSSYADSLGELGGTSLSSDAYNGVAMTLIDSLDTLIVMGNYSAFQDAVKYIVKHVSFDQDIRVNIFETNIRVLGGLLSAHLLATDEAISYFGDYDGGLLTLALDLGHRLLLAFNSKTGIPFAWVNLRNGVVENETSNSCTAGVGTLILEFGMLSHLTGQMEFYDVAYSALMILWTMRDSKTGLVGNNLDVQTGKWTDDSAGIGAGIDSFYEYLFKAYVLFGNQEFLHMFQQSYESVMKHLRVGPWYHEASMRSGFPTHVQFNSLQAFWPGLQVLSGFHLEDAVLSQKAFFSLWAKYGALPERFLLGSMTLHSTERYYPLRPELMESTYLLYQATGDAIYLHMGEHMAESLFNMSYVENGFASVRDVEHRILEDRMPSFFLAETCKYLYLLYDPDSFVHQHGNYVFSTEGHLFPVNAGLHYTFANRKPRRWRLDPVFPSMSPVMSCSADFRWGVFPRSRQRRFVTEDETEPDVPLDPDSRVHVRTKNGAFIIEGVDGSEAIIRHLGTPVIEVFYRNDGDVRLFTILQNYGVREYTVAITTKCKRIFGAAGSDFGLDLGQLAVGIHGEIAILSPGDGCGPNYNNEPVRNKVVIVDRGGCTFKKKAQVAQEYGASGLIIVNIEDDGLFFMNGDETIPSISIPVVMITAKDANIIKDCSKQTIFQNTIEAEINVVHHQFGEIADHDVSVVGNSRAFVITTGQWKVLCQRVEKSYTLTYLI